MLCLAKRQPGLAGGAGAGEGHEGLVKWELLLEGLVLVKQKSQLR